MSNSDCCLPGVQTDVCDQDNLIGDCQVRTTPVTLVAGSYSRGDILFQTAVDGVYSNFANDNAVVEANAVGVMPFTVTLSDPDEVAVYVGGEFNQNEVTYGTLDLTLVKQTLINRDVRLRQFS